MTTAALRFLAQLIDFALYQAADERSRRERGARERRLAEIRRLT